VKPLLRKEQQCDSINTAAGWSAAPACNRASLPRCKRLVQVWVCGFCTCLAAAASLQQIVHWHMLCYMAVGAPFRAVSLYYAWQAVQLSLRFMAPEGGSSWMCQLPASCLLITKLQQEAVAALSAARLAAAPAEQGRMCTAFNSIGFFYASCFCTDLGMHCRGIPTRSPACHGAPPRRRQSHR
jgi:hypothetical protein